MAAKIQAYVLALKVLQAACKAETPIRKTDFCKQYKISSNLWQALKVLNVVSVEVSSHREGTIFSWQYKRADNELDGLLAQKVITQLSEYNKKWQDKKQALGKNYKPKFKRGKYKPRVQVTLGAEGINVSDRLLELAGAPKQAAPVAQAPPVSELLPVSERAELLEFCFLMAANSQSEEEARNLHTTIMVELNDLIRERGNATTVREVMAIVKRKNESNDTERV